MRACGFFPRVDASRRASFSEIVVGENPESRAGQSGGVDEAGVRELVEDDEIRLADDGGDHAERGGEAGGEGERRFRLLGCGKRVFQQLVRRQRPADEPGCGGAGTEFSHAFDSAASISGCRASPR